jgi:hypothetical protein
MHEEQKGRVPHRLHGIGREATLQVPPDQGIGGRLPCGCDRHVPAADTGRLAVDTYGRWLPANRKGALDVLDPPSASLVTNL